ncbi:hypothetical protein NXH64_07685 [Butyrivibrio fibrisolvens]|nr:hypothetical protein [Butyrivibrio fibrisolvens]
MVKAIYVVAPDKSSGKRTQHIHIQYYGLGFIPLNELLSDPYHYQTCIASLYDVVLYIVGHDEYQMRNRHNVSVEEEKRSGSYFWKLIDIYGLTA